MTAKTVVARLLTSSPISFLLFVNIISGIIAKGSWKLRYTWLNTSSCSGLTSIPIAITAGIITINRKINRPTHGRIRISKNPSITNSPAIVPVGEDEIPEHSNASANTKEDMRSLGASE